MYMHVGAWTGPGPDAGCGALQALALKKGGEGAKKGQVVDIKFAAHFPGRAKGDFSEGFFKGEQA